MVENTSIKGKEGTMFKKLMIAAMVGSALQFGCCATGAGHDGCKKDGMKAGECGHGGKKCGCDHGKMGKKGGCDHGKTAAPAPAPAPAK